MHWFCVSEVMYTVTIVEAYAHLIRVADLIFDLWQIQSWKVYFYTCRNAEK